MFSKAFRQAPSGRIFLRTLALALVSASVLTFMGPGPHLTVTIVVLCTILSLGATAAVMFAVAEGHTFDVMGILFIFPWLFPLYFLYLNLWTDSGALIAGLLLVAGIVPGVISLQADESEKAAA